MTEFVVVPCPFCGNDGSGPIEHALHVSHIEDEGHHAYDRYTVQCDKCTATMGYFDSEDEALEAWNTRAAPSPTHASDAVREALQALSDAADEMNGHIDLNIEDQRHNFGEWIDAQEFTVVMTWQQIKAFDRAIIEAQKHLRAPALSTIPVAPETVGGELYHAIDKRAGREREVRVTLLNDGGWEIVVPATPAPSSPPIAAQPATEKWEGPAYEYGVTWGPEAEAQPAVVVPPEREALARHLCNAGIPRAIAEQEDAPDFDNSEAHVQEYWRSVADAALHQQAQPVAGDAEEIARIAEAFPPRPKCNALSAALREHERAMRDEVGPQITEDQREQARLAGRLRLGLPAEDGAEWTCSARKQSLPEPADCDWPVCGCDPYADEVIAALEGDGRLQSQPVAGDKVVVPRELLKSLLEAAEPARLQEAAQAAFGAINRVPIRRAVEKATALLTAHQQEAK